MREWGGSEHMIASFPASRALAQKKEPGTHCLCMLSPPRISGNDEGVMKAISFSLTVIIHASVLNAMEHN